MPYGPILLGMGGRQYHGHGNFDLIKSKNVQIGTGIGQINLVELQSGNVLVEFWEERREIRRGIGNEVNQKKLMDRYRYR